MNVEQMTKKDFASVKLLERKKSLEVEFETFVIIPTAKKHDSGYPIMRFCLCNGEDEPIGLIEVGSDVINLQNTNYGRSEQFPKNGIHTWNIDCLPTSGYLRVWCEHTMQYSGFSNFSVFATKRVKQ
jgi:hypothetical protein